MTVTVATAVLVMLAACRRSSSANGSGARAGATAAVSGGVGKAFDDSVEIRTTDGTMKLGLARDTIFMGLTDSVLTVARNDMARDTEAKSAFAGTIERFVKQKVSSALQSRLKYPLADIDSATYANGTIKFAYRNRRTMAFEDVSQNGHKALQSFSPADAQEFVNTVNSAIKTERGGSQ